MPETLTDEQWDSLLPRIADGKCTPFIGAGACAGSLPLGGKLACDMAHAAKRCPPRDCCGDLARVAQFVATMKDDPMAPKDLVLKVLDIPNAQPPDTTNGDEPHDVLASLPLPVYLTTNYDDFMIRALKAQNRSAEREFCRWSPELDDYEDWPNILAKDSGYRPSPERPLVYHLHGHNGVPESVVVTEDDYLAFMVNVSPDAGTLPPAIGKAVARASLVFIGYSLADWNFRVLFHRLVRSMTRSLQYQGVTVQLPVEEQQQSEYLKKYFSDQRLQVVFGTARGFAAELRQRWEAFRGVDRAQDQ